MFNALELFPDMVIIHHMWLLGIWKMVDLNWDMLKEFTTVPLCHIQNPSAMQGTQERWVLSLDLEDEDPLGKEMATPTNMLSWKIPWTEEPGRLQFMGSQRVGHDWASEHACMKEIQDLG